MTTKTTLKKMHNKSRKDKKEEIIKILLNIVDRLPDYESTISKNDLERAICDELGLCHSCKMNKIPKAIRGNDWYLQFCKKCATRLDNSLK